MKNYIKHFCEIDINDIPFVDGKNAALGEMFQKLTSKNVKVPDGFAITSDIYWYYLEKSDLKETIFKELNTLNKRGFSNLKKIGAAIRTDFSKVELPNTIKEDSR